MGNESVGKNVKDADTMVMMETLFDSWPYDRVDNIARNGNDGNAYSIWQHVISDMEIREQEGFKSYGKYLTTDSTEDMLEEAYKESLDLCVYLKTEIMKRDK